MQRTLQPLSRSFSDSQIETLVSLTTQDLEEKEIELKTIKENFKKLLPLEKYAGKQLESLIQCVVKHIEAFSEHKDDGAVIESCLLFSKLNNTFRLQNSHLSTQLIKKTNNLLVRALCRSGQHEIACKIRLQQMEIFNNEFLWHETIQIYKEIVSLINEFKKTNTFIHSIKGDELLFQVYSLQIDALMHLKDHPQANDLCEKQLSLAKALHHFYSILNSPETYKYREAVQHKIITKKQQIDIAAQASLIRIECHIINDIRLYNLKNNSNIEISKPKLDEIVRSIYRAEFYFCSQEIKSGLHYCEEALKDSKIPFILPSHFIATTYYQMSIDTNNADEEKIYLLTCVNHCTQILKHFDYAPAYKINGFSLMKLKDYAKAYENFAKAIILNDFNESGLDPLKFREGALAMLIECEANLLIERTKPTDQTIDLMDIANRLMNQGDSYQAAQKHAEAKNSYGEAIKFYTEKLIQSNVPGTLPCNTSVGLIFFKRSLAKFKNNLLETALQDVQIAQVIIKSQIDIAVRLSLKKEIQDELAEDLDNCVHLSNAITFGIKNQNLPVCEMKALDTTPAPSKKKKKHKKVKKTDPAVTPSPNAASIENKSSLTHTPLNVLPSNETAPKVTILSKEQLQKLKQEEKKREDARRKEIKKQNLEIENKRKAELKELANKKALEVEAEKIKKAQEVKEIKAKEEEAARIEKEARESEAQKKQTIKELRIVRKSAQQHKKNFQPVLQELIKTAQSKEVYKKIEAKAMQDIIDDLMTDLIVEESQTLILNAMAKAKQAENQRKLLQIKSKAEAIAISAMYGETKLKLSTPEKTQPNYQKPLSPRLAELKLNFLSQSLSDTSDSSDEFSPVSSVEGDFSDRDSPLSFTKSNPEKSPSLESKLTQDPYRIFYRHLQFNGSIPITLNLPSKVILQLKKLKSSGVPFSFVVGGLIRDHLLGREYGQNYKDRKEGDNDLLIPSTPFETIKRSFPNAFRIHLNVKHELITTPEITEFYLYDVPDANKYKIPFKKDGTYQDIFDETQIKESPYFQGNFADPMRAEMLSRDLEINSGFVDELGRFYALPETIHALQHHLISIPNKLELLRMEAQAMNQEFDESLWFGKTNEQIAYELDIRIFLRALLALSHLDLALSEGVRKSIPIGLSILEDKLYSNPIIAKQINTLLQTKIFRHAKIMAIRRFKIFTDHGVNRILFPGLLESVQSNNLSTQLDQVLAIESSLEKTYCGFLVLQYLTIFLKLSADEMKDDYFLTCFIQKLIENKPLLSVYFDNYSKFKKINDPSLNDIVRNFLKVFTPKPAPTQPVSQTYANLSMFSLADDLPDAAPSPMFAQPIPGQVI